MPIRPTLTDVSVDDQPLPGKPNDAPASALQSNRAKALAFTYDVPSGQAILIPVVPNGPSLTVRPPTTSLIPAIEFSKCRQSAPPFVIVKFQSAPLETGRTRAGVNVTCAPLA